MSYAHVLFLAHMHLSSYKRENTLPPLERYQPHKYQQLFTDPGNSNVLASYNSLEVLYLQGYS
jgi:hypothetical protein